MSASTERKNRQLAREAGTDKKLIAQKEAEEKARKSKRKWTLGTIGVIVLIAAIILLDSGLLTAKTTAVTIGDTKYTPAEVNYYYAEQFYTFYQNYGSYASMFGLDVSQGMYGLASQECSMTDGGTWKDYFLDAAYTQMKSIQAAVDYAEDNGITLTDEEIAEVDESMESLKEAAKEQGYGSTNAYVKALYGEGVNTNTVRSAALRQSLAAKTAEFVEDSCTYTAEELAEEYASYDGSYDVFNYAYYYVAAETTETTDADGNTTTEVSEEALEAAKKTAGSIYSALRANTNEDMVARLNESIASVLEGEECTESGDVKGSSLGEFAEWVGADERAAGDIFMFEDEAATGYYVVGFISRDRNDYPTVSVRHILIKAEADEDGEYTDEAKAAAKAKIEEIEAEYMAGEQTEEAFAALAEKYSEDSGSNTNGGLYENIYKGKTVEEFDAFCFAEHKTGDTAVVYGETTSYTGYHLIYYIGEGQNYCDYIAESALTSEELETWLADLTDSLTVTEGYGFRFVG